MELSNEEKKQYNRHLILGPISQSGQVALKKAKVLVIGAGGLGCPVLQYLTAAGVGTIGIIDHDNIEISNLQRQVLYTHDDIGHAKATVAAQKLSRLNPFINFKIHLCKLSTLNAIELFFNYDIIVDGSDNFPTRYLVNDAAVLTGKPVVFGSILKFEGQVSVFNYKNGPTYRCLYPNPPEQNTTPNCSETGVLGVLPGVIGSFQANEVLKIILGIGQVLSGKMICYDALQASQLVIEFKKDTTLSIEKLTESYDLFCGFALEINEMTLKIYNQNKENYNLLDVRSAEERQEYYLESLHIPLQELKYRISEIPKNKNLAVFCKSGMRSKKAIAILTENGFEKDLYNLKLT